MTSTHDQEELLLLRQIEEGTAGSVGTDFFRSLVRSLAEALEVHGVWVTEYLEKEQRLRSLAFWVNHAFVEHYEYAIRNTPCEPVLQCPNEVFHIPDKVVQLYPKDPDLVPLGAVSYMGVALKNSNGKIIGHLAVLNNRPMPKRLRLMTIFRIFAARAAAEMQRIDAEKSTRESEERLQRLVNGTHDAIIELKENLQISQANKAAVDMFDLDPDAIEGLHLKKLLRIDGLKKITQAILCIKDQTQEEPYYWIQGHITCCTPSEKNFPAEGTITAYRCGSDSYFILILRNVKYKQAAEEKIRTLTIERQLLQEEIKNIYNLGEIIGTSQPMLAAMQAVQQVAATGTTVLLLGESGTGKELFARAIHSAGSRSEKPMIKLNCAALPAGLIESELFGHEKGSFTGATAKRDGRFLLADKGTIFLDEIGELPLELQAKLLRVIQEGEFEPVGSNRTLKVNVRVIAATNRHLHEAVKAGRFREDLYYRLNVFPIAIPPLRDRGDDVLKMADAFIERFSCQMHKTVKPLPEREKQKLLTYRWPGNVRELQNVIERAVIVSEDGELHLLVDNHQQDPSARSAESANNKSVLTARAIRQLEKENILRALQITGGKVSGADGAAALLQLPSTTLSSRMKALGIVRDFPVSTEGC